jgi:hypothetical protein
MPTGTGSEPWTALWEAARRFSQESAYPSQAFPVRRVRGHSRREQQRQDYHHRHEHAGLDGYAPAVKTDWPPIIIATGKRAPRKDEMRPAA